MTILEQTGANEIRDCFITAFVDTDLRYYRERIRFQAEHSDGLCYDGYLWECLKVKERVTSAYALEFLRSRTESVYVFWDIHSRDKIWALDYWKYPKEAMLKLRPGEVEQYLPTLPEDCYFCDASLAWTVVFTHEESKPGRRICYLSETV